MFRHICLNIWKTDIIYQNDSVDQGDTSPPDPKRARRNSQTLTDGSSGFQNGAGRNVSSSYVTDVSNVQQNPTAAQQVNLEHQARVPIAYSELVNRFSSYNKCQGDRCILGLQLAHQPIVRSLVQHHRNRTSSQSMPLLRWLLRLKEFQAD